MAARKTAGARSGARTKAELEAELNDLRARVSGQPAVDPKAAEMQRTHETQVRKATEGVSVEKVVETIGKTSLEVSRSLAQVSEQLTSKVQELDSVNEALTLARTELEELHSKEVLSSSIASLIAEHDAKAKQFSLENDARRLEWQKEEQAHAQLVRERDAELQKARTRESADFEYAKTQERKKQQDAFNEQLRLQGNQNRDKQEDLERSWAQREGAIKAQEEHLKSLEAQVAAFPEQLKKESARDVAIATGSQKREFEFSSQIAKKDFDAANALLKQQIVSLQETNKTLNDRATQLEGQLTDAKRQVAEIANKALDASSGALALDRVSALSQRNNGEAPKRGTS